MKDTIVLVRVLGRKEIEAILPHRGRMLLLDRVVIGTERIIGEFTVTREVCEGHAVWDGELVLKGSDLLDMSAQLLAVFLASQCPQFLGRTCRLREYGGSKFKAPIRPSEKIIIEVAVVDIEVEEKTTVVFVTGTNFVVWDWKKEEIKAEIYGVKLIVA